MASGWMNRRSQQIEQVMAPFIGCMSKLKNRLNKLLRSRRQANLPMAPSPKKSAIYNSFMNEARANELGIKPIAAELAKAQSFKDAKEFHQLLGEPEARGLGGLFYAYVTTDHMDSTQNIVYPGPIWPFSA
jgi:predicted metalloendopeptidase